MANDSATGGYLLPTDEPEYDDDLDDVLQKAIVGISGLSGDLVRPRWTAEPVDQPAFDQSWVAFGIQRSPSDVHAYVRWHDDEQVYRMQKDELLYVLHSFYGPKANAFLSRYIDGLQLAQNREELFSHGIGVVEAQEPVHVPALQNRVWVKRVDVTVLFRRRTSRIYPVLTILQGDVGLDNERYLTPLNITN